VAGLGDEGAGEGTEPSGGEHGADADRAQTQVARHVQDVDREEHPAEQVGGGGASGEDPQERVGEHRPQSLADVRRDAGPLTRCGGRRLGDSYGQEEQRRRDVRDGVDENRERRADQLDEHAAGARAHDLRDRCRHLELAIALDQSIAVDQRRQIGEVGHVEQHGQRAGRERDRVQQLDSQHPEPARERDDEQERRATQVRGDHHRSPPAPIHPHTREEADEQGGRRLGR